MPRRSRAGSVSESVEGAQQEASQRLDHEILMQSEEERRRAEPRAPGGGTRAAIVAGDVPEERQARGVAAQKQLDNVARVQILVIAPGSPKWARRERRQQ